MVFPRLILVLSHGAGKTLDLELEGASVRVKVSPGMALVGFTSSFLKIRNDP